MGAQNAVVLSPSVLVPLEGLAGRWRMADRQGISEPRSTEMNVPASGEGPAK